MLIFFSCPCFVSDVEHAIVRSTKNYEINAYINSKHVVKNFEIYYFENEKSVFVLIILSVVCVSY